MTKPHDVLIVGGGLSGLSVAHFLSMMQPALKVLILEKEGRPGGAIQTLRQDGFTAEWGPHGFLNNAVESLELLKDTGLDQESQTAPLGDFLRYVCHRGKLVALPQNPRKLLSTPLLSLAGKLRLLGDLFIKPRPEDQTIGDWAAYRFGPGVLPLVDAAVTGTFAGDYQRLSIDAVMPGVRQLEKECGSVLRGLKKKKKPATGAASGGLPAMLNFPQGMERFVEALAQNKEIQCGVTVQAVSKKGSAWEIATNKGDFQAKKLVLALPVNQALKLLAPLSPPPVESIPVAKIINVVMGFTQSAKAPYGFGYLAPERENRFALGAMFTSHMFPGRAPEGKVLLEVLVGGRRHPERLELDDGVLIQKAYEDLRQLLHLPEPPCFTKVLRPKAGIPQLEMNHPALRPWLTALERDWAGLHVCGFGWEGVGMNDMTKAAKKVSREIAAGREEGSESAQVKPVYF